MPEFLVNAILLAPYIDTCAPTLALPHWIEKSFHQEPPLFAQRSSSDKGQGQVFRSVWRLRETLRMNVLDQLRCHIGT
jgi:hypothetical protein